MWYPVKLIAKNFKSFSELEYDFQKGKTTLIYAYNFDEEGADSNGAGKSSVVAALTVALLGVPDNSIPKEDYINDYADSCELYLSLRNDSLDKTIEISREYSKKDSVFSITEDGVFNDQMTSTDAVNKRIIDLIGISKEDILNYYIINQDNSHSFFKATDAQQKKIIFRFTNANLVDKAIEAIQKDIEEVNKLIQASSDKISKWDVRAGVLQEQIEYESTKKVEEFKEHKEEIKSQIGEAKDSIEEDKQILESSLTKLKKIEKIMGTQQPMNGNSFEMLEDEIRDKETTLEEKEKKIKEAKKLYDELDLILDGKITCPKCKYSWNPGGDYDLKEVEESLKKVEKIKKALNKTIDKIETELSELKEIEKEEQDKEREHDTRRTDHSILKNKIKKVEDRIKGNEEQISMLRKQLKDLDRVSVDQKRIKALEAEILDIELKKSEEDNVVIVLQKQKEELSYWNINLGIKGFKTFLTNKVLEGLEGYVNSFLRKFRTNLMVKIQGFKTLKTGEVRENINILVSRDGGTVWKNFKRHSGGQKQRVNVCGILTIQNLINNSAPSGGLDLLVLDEFFEGLDQRGQAGIINILEKSGITTLVISHNNAEIGAENQLWIAYEEETSKVSTRKNIYEKRESRENKSGKGALKGKKAA